MSDGRGGHNNNTEIASIVKGFLLENIKNGTPRCVSYKSETSFALTESINTTIKGILQMSLGSGVIGNISIDFEITGVEPFTKLENKINPLLTT